MQESLEYAAWPLWWGLPSTLIPHDNRAFQKHLNFKPDKFENTPLSVSASMENILKMVLFENDDIFNLI